MKRWRPLTHADCQDGYTKESEHQCIFWDCFYKVCVQAAWLFLAHDRMSTQEREQLLPAQLDEDDAIQ